MNKQAKHAINRVSFKKNRISSYIGKAIGDYALIKNNDKLLVAVSGGKDSLTLLKLLRDRQNWAPVKYEIVACHIETDFRCSSCMHTELLEAFFKDIDVKYTFKKIKIPRSSKNTNCFWCSWNRRKALFQIANKLNCNKIAFGHHKDDIVETTLLNLFFNGQFSTMNPRQEMFGGSITIIRPLCYVEEERIKEFANENGLPSTLCKCPYSNKSKRSYVKKLIQEIKKESPYIKTNILSSMARIKYDYLDIRSNGSSKCYNKR